MEAQTSELVPAVRTGAGVTIALCFAVAVLEGLDIQAMGVAAPRLAAELHLPGGVLGQALSSSNIGLVVGATLGGWLADKIGRKPLLIASVLVFGAFTLGTMYAFSYESLFALRVGAGLGFGGALTNLNAREPNKSDLKELQLADVVEEMAIAAGLPSPKVMLVDSPGANAAVIGTSAADARVVISRRLLDDLDRDELQAILAHVIASIGNGDLRIAFMVTSVFETCGLLVTLINAPFGKEARGKLWRTLRYAFHRGPASASDSAEAEAVAALLAGSIDVDEDYFDNKNKPFLVKVFRFIFFPLIFTNMCIEFTLWMFVSLLLGPCMALLWRTRRYLADAGAVQLSRNPTAMAEALKRLSQDSTTILSGDWASHLFVLNPKGDHTLAHVHLAEFSSGQGSERVQRIVRAWALSAPPGSQQDEATTPENVQRMQAEIKAAEIAAIRGDQAARARMVAFGFAISRMHGAGAYPSSIPSGTSQKKGATGLQSQSVMSFHPSLKRRLRRLERMGARYSPEAHARRSVALIVVMTILYLIVVPLLTVAGLMMLMVMAMLIMMNLMVLTLWMTVIHAIFTYFGAPA